MYNHLVNMVNGVNTIGVLKNNENKNIKIDSVSYNTGAIIFKNEIIDLSELNISILNFETIIFSKCIIKGKMNIIIYNFKELLIEDCIFEDFENRTMFIESSQENNSKCKISNCKFERCGNLCCSNEYNALVIDIFDVSEVCIENCKFENLKCNKIGTEVSAILLREIKTKARLINNEISGKIENAKLYNYFKVEPEIISTE